MVSQSASIPPMTQARRSPREVWRGWDRRQESRTSAESQGSWGGEMPPMMVRTGGSLRALGWSQRGPTTQRRRGKNPATLSPQHTEGRRRRSGIPPLPRNQRSGVWVKGIPLLPRSRRDGVRVPPQGRHGCPTLEARGQRPGSRPWWVTGRALQEGGRGAGLARLATTDSKG